MKSNLLIVAIIAVALCACKKEDAAGTESNPYTVTQAREAVKNLTWTTNTDYEKTDIVYVKGIISRVVDSGTYLASGTYGNASFYISDDGSENNELFCYRMLYLGNQKYTGGPDVKKGYNVVICGELMNYRNETPETVSGKAYLYSITLK